MHNKYISIIESILFVWGEPIHIDEICKVLDLNKKDVRQVISLMQDQYKIAERGIELKVLDDYLQLSTKKEHDEYISKLVNKTKKKTLSNSAMEVLAIIAYKQPITRLEIDDIRGVKSYSSIENLIGKKLIQEVGRLDKIGKPILYGTTKEFLASFDLSSIKDLPKVDKLESLDDYLIGDDDED